MHIGKNVWLGGDVKILAGVTIGDNTIISAGSVVTKSIPANVIAVGTPLSRTPSHHQSRQNGLSEKAGAMR